MKKVHLIMPMAGNGIRFLDKGISCPKPLIDLEGKPFFYWSVNSLKDKIQLEDIYFIVLEEHVKNYKIDEIIRRYYPESKIIAIPKVLNGSVLTALNVVNKINDDKPVIFNDCDHCFCSREFYDFCNGSEENNIDAGILTFTSDSKSYSYARCDDDGFVLETVEKQVISSNAICGLYYFSSIKLLDKYAKYYLNSCPYQEYFFSGIYNELIKSNKKVKNFKTDYHISFGTPKEYEMVIKNRELDKIKK